MGFEACDLLRKGLGDVMIDLRLFFGYVSVCCYGATVVTTTHKTVAYGY